MRSTAYGGDRFAVVLDFAFLSRRISSKQSMVFCRQVGEYFSLLELSCDFNVKIEIDG
jgi:hypothetical protein